MYTRILGLLLVGYLMAAAPLWAQQEPGYTQFSWDQLVINPAYAGSKDALSARMFYCRQWVGLEGAPQTFPLQKTIPTPLHPRCLSVA